MRSEVWQRQRVGVYDREESGVGTELAESRGVPQRSLDLCMNHVEVVAPSRARAWF